MMATLTALDAQRLTAQLRESMEHSNELLVQAYQGRIWEPLRYESWGAYVASELPRFRMVKALDPEERAAEWAEQVCAGLSQAAVAEAAGVGKATISRALKEKELPDTAVGRDGKVRSTRSTVPPRNGTHGPSPVRVPELALTADVIADATNWQVVRRHVSKAGARGLTCHEFEQATGWGHGKASAAFHSCETKGYIRRDGTLRRLVEKGPGHGVYTVIR